jgi:hypothetical protein
MKWVESNETGTATTSREASAWSSAGPIQNASGRRWQAGPVATPLPEWSHPMLKRLIVIPAVALILFSFGSHSRAQFGGPFGPYITWCFTSGPVPPGYRIVSQISSFLCPNYHDGVNNAYMLLPN